MEQNKKSIFLARNRIVYPQAIYHLTNRAPGREVLFLEDSDYLHILSLVKEATHKFKWNVFCFCMMPNHVHFLIQINEENLSQGAKNIFERYAKYFNKKYERKGPVFCKPFRASLCLDDSYLLVASLYIHLNPLKAKLVDNIEEYKWSSLGLYIKEDKSTFVDYKFILDMLSDNINGAKKMYRELLKSSAKVEYKNISQDKNALIRFILNFMKLKDLLNIKRIKREKSFLLWEEIGRCRNKKGSRQPKDLKAKCYLIEQLRANGYKISEISSFLGVSRQTIYRWIQNVTK